MGARKFPEPGSSRSQGVPEPGSICTLKHPANYRICRTIRAIIRYPLPPPSPVSLFPRSCKKNGSCLEAGPFLGHIPGILQVPSQSIPKPLEYLPGRPCPGTRVGSLAPTKGPKSLEMTHTQLGSMPSNLVTTQGGHSATESGWWDPVDRPPSAVP